MNSALFAEELNTFCFEKNVNLKSVESSVGFLLLPQDQVILSLKEHCIEITSSPNRGKLFEKYLSKSYSLVKSGKEEASAGETFDKETNCNLTFKTTTTTKQDNNNLQVGKNNSVKATSKTQSYVNNMELLLGSGQSGELDVGSEKLKVLCQFNEEFANLTFSFVSTDKATVRTEVRTKKGEWLNLASIVRELNEKKKTLGIPQTEIDETNGKSETTYELQFR